MVNRIGLKGMWSIALTLVLFAASVNASVVVRCDSCNYPTRESVSIAAANVSLGRTHETVYLFDIQNKELYVGSVDFDEELNQAIFTSVEASLAENQGFDQFHDAYVQAKNEIESSSGVYIPSSQFDNIYDISGCPACAEAWRQSNLPAIANQLSLLDILAARVGELSATLGASQASVSATVAGEIEFKVYLTSDDTGGPFDAYCTGSLSGTGVSIDSSNCVDSDGNPVPVSPNDLALRYRFTASGNYGGFVGRITGMGVPYTGGGTVTVGDEVQVNCGVDGCIENEGS